MFFKNLTKLLLALLKKVLEILGQSFAFESVVKLETAAGTAKFLTAFRVEYFCLTGFALHLDSLDSVPTLLLASQAKVFLFL